MARVKIIQVNKTVNQLTYKNYIKKIFLFRYLFHAASSYSILSTIFPLCNISITLKFYKMGYIYIYKN